MNKNLEATLFWLPAARGADSSLFYYSLAFRGKLSGHLCTWTTSLKNERSVILLVGCKEIHAACGILPEFR